MTGWDVFAGRACLAPGTLTQLHALQAALPSYNVTISSHAPIRRFEAVRRPGGPEAGPWCVISTEPADLWHELVPWARAYAPCRRGPCPLSGASHHCHSV